MHSLEEAGMRSEVRVIDVDIYTCVCIWSLRRLPRGLRLSVDYSPFPIMDYFRVSDSTGARKNSYSVFAFV